jgi:hypothetical protein
MKKSTLKATQLSSKESTAKSSQVNFAVESSLPSIQGRFVDYVFCCTDYTKSKLTTN